MGFQGSPRAVLAGMALLAVSGCSGAGSIPRSSATAGTGLSLALHDRASRIGPALPAMASGTCTAPLTFVSDDGYNLIHVFSGSTECNVLQPKDFADPQGLDVDANGTLYVADLLWSEILEVKPPYTSVSKRLDDSGQYPADVAVCNGYVAVTNLVTNGDGPGSVSIYRGGSSSPTSTLVDPKAKAGSEFFAACDSHGNLFTSYCTHSIKNAIFPCEANRAEGRVNEWKLGKGNAIELSNIVTQYPGGIDWSRGTLYVGDQYARTVRAYKLPYNSITKTIALTQAGDPISFQIIDSNKGLIDADAQAKDAQIYSFRGTQGHFVRSITSGDMGQPIGIATTGDVDR